MKKIEAQYLRATKDFVNSNLNENPSKCNRQIETSKLPNLQNPQIVKTPKLNYLDSVIEFPFHILSRSDQICCSRSESDSADQISLPL
jgi:hypothetical protein